jgi:hypothetical protein
LPPFWSDLLGDLRDEVWRLRAAANSAPGEEQATIQGMQDELKEKDAQIAGLKAKYENFIFVMFALVFGLVAGRMLMQ